MNNYTSIIYQEQTIELVQSCANEVWNESNIYYEVSCLTQSSELNSESIFNDFLEMNSNYLRFDIKIKESIFNNENQVNNFIDTLRDSIDDKLTQNEYIKFAIAEVNGVLDAIQCNE